MTNEWIKSNKLAATPILMVAAIAAFYLLFQALYIKCDTFQINVARCQPVDVTILFARGSYEPVDRDATALIKSQEKRGELTGEALSRLQIASRYSGRNMWVFITCVSAVLSIGILIISAYLIHKSSSFRRETAF